MILLELRIRIPLRELVKDFQRYPCLFPISHEQGAAVVCIDRRDTAIDSHHLSDLHRCSSEGHLGGQRFKSQIFRDFGMDPQRFYP